MNVKELAGWIGVPLILLAYSLVTFGLIQPKDILYGLMNLLGSFGIILSSYHKRDLQPVLLNGIWLAVALIGIVKNIS